MAAVRDRSRGRFEGSREEGRVGGRRLVLGRSGGEGRREQLLRGSCDGHGGRQVYAGWRYVDRCVGRLGALAAAFWKKKRRVNTCKRAGSFFAVSRRPVLPPWGFIVSNEKVAGSIQCIN